MSYTNIPYYQVNTIYTNSMTSPGSEMGTSSYTMDSVKTSDPETSSRKRKMITNIANDYEDDTADDNRSVKTTDEQKKQNHSEIEKRRRDKMNTYISELSSMVPMCHAMPRKLDKLTVLRMAVQHMKTIRGTVHSYTEGLYKPAFLSDQELKMLILQAADGFLFVVGCDRGRILYVSESVSQILNYNMGELLGQSWFDILHPKDVAKVKEQLSSSDLNPRDRLIDAKTMLPVKTDVPCGVTRLCPGARRSFFCRMKCKLTNMEANTNVENMSGRTKKHHDRKYSVIQCTGYLKSWAPAKIGIEEQEGEGDSETGTLSCLVAVGRVQPPICSVLPHGCMNSPELRTIQFISRHAMDGKFLFVDQRSTLVLGFLPQELLGTSMYEYYHPEDIGSLAETHKLSLMNSSVVKTTPYRLRTKEGTYIHLQSEWKSFRNPWTKDVEYLIAKNSVITPEINNYTNTQPVNNQASTSFDFNQFNQNDREMQRYINTHVEYSKIGCQVADEALKTQRRTDITEVTNHPTQQGNSEMILYATNEMGSDLNQITGISSSDVVLAEPTSTVITEHTTNGINGALPNFNQIYNNPTMGISRDKIGEGEKNMIEMIEGSPGREPQKSTDGSNEEAMAVIMSLLEADAGLGDTYNGLSGNTYPVLHPLPGYVNNVRRHN